MESLEDVVFKYSPKQRYSNTRAYMELYFGLCPNFQGIPVLCDGRGNEFTFSDLEDVYYIFPFGRQEEHHMVIVGPDGTLFAHGGGEHAGVMWATQDKIKIVPMY